MKKNSWLTKSIFGIGLTSLFSDMGHEMTTAILPIFLATIDGTAATLGLLWVKVSPAAGFIYAGSLTLIGSIFLGLLRNRGDLQSG